MGRKKKLLNGRTRTTLLRQGQIEELDETADRLGCDFSDVIRSSLDFLLPCSPDDLRVRTLAALERNLRAVPRQFDEVQKLICARWAGKKTQQLEQVLRHLRLDPIIDQTVRMLKKLNPSQTAKSPEPQKLPDTSFEYTRMELLVLLASTAVRVLELDDSLRPRIVLVATVLLPPKGSTPVRSAWEWESRVESDMLERQYIEPSFALLALLHDERVKDVTQEYLGRLGAVLRCSAFAIQWDRCQYQA